MYNYSYPMFNNSPQYQQGFSAQPQRDERIWVQGEIGAKAYMVVPGSTVALWDSESPVIWLKTVGANGMPQMQKLQYSFDVAPDAIETRLAAIERRLSALEPKEVTNE